MIRILVLVVLLAGSLVAHAAVDTYEFSSEALRQRYLQFAQELRCPKCQNQNLADSNAPIAADLRAELYRLLEEGRSDQEIIDFMVSRYGDYVLYKPPLEPRTWLLWGAPALMLFGGIAVLAALVRRARHAATATTLSDQEQQRLQRLLDEKDTRL